MKKSMYCIRNKKTSSYGFYTMCGTSWNDGKMWFRLSEAEKILKGLKKSDNRYNDYIVSKHM